MFFKKKKDGDPSDDLAKVAALLIHAAKIDENFSDKEEKIIKQTLIKIDTNNLDIESIFKKGKTFEENSNQILDFTREVKNMDEKNKIKIVEALWQIIYSNNEADIYETNLMRRLSGLLYLDPKVVGDIKEKVRQKKI